MDPRKTLLIMPQVVLWLQAPSCYSLHTHGKWQTTTPSKCIIYTLIDLLTHCFVKQIIGKLTFEFSLILTRFNHENRKKKTTAFKMINQESQVDLLHPTWKTMESMTPKQNNSIKTKQPTHHHFLQLQRKYETI